MKKVLICATDYLPHVGGAELAVSEIAKRLASQGYIFDLITARLDTKLPRYEYIDGVHVFRVGFGFWFDKFLLPCLGLMRYVSLSRRPYDVVWSLMASQGSVLASCISIISKTPLLLTLQEGDEEEHLARYALGSRLLYRLFIRPWHALVFKRAKRITAISEHLKVRAEQRSRAPVDIVPNGVNLTHFSQVDDQLVERIKQTYNLVGKKVVVSVSRLVKKNNIAMLVRAFTHVLEDTMLFVVGEGDQKKSLELLVGARTLSHRVVFVGSVDPKEVPAYVHAGDVFARVSLSEGFGSAFLEAFAAGVPVVASPVGGIVDIVKDGETGLLVSPDDEHAIAQAIERLFADEHLRQTLIDNSKVMAQKYSWDTVADLMRQSFDQM
ncbi:MAG: hypothetical protein COV34_00975 [Candidatus Zambryskibacteria bacterium CG10_big_fil_rev_8_21_14_0_10_42_12]|uniref:Glycosyltransferase subfamily 4-like N-terminal domain-containing protein n=1 Tax=Candidatus Zambryskibacteria bacterium CG10_big_fil_rev_8_21_14_0_10_42_12 TaxID=1975115 RepID=A0A2H0QX45_9BACT|nr:MAG: hypothetical protein COV34_00975 [Candidatus Zambryskibacteria bacterium CG10_big_fil_rev_8_21_14_0_10_42_12]